MAMKPFDPATEPFLNGIFAPTTRECTDAPLELLAGALPADLAGTYYRNGPNARFPPIGSYTYPLDGDGMVHAVTFEGGRATYRNRFVRTPSIVAEERAGRALWGGVMTPIMPAPAAAPEMAGAYKDLPDVNVVAHGGRFLALAEGGRPFALDTHLATLGPFDYGGKLAQGFTAHPKIDRATGEMIVFRYGFAPPLLTWAVIGADGTVTREETPIAVDATYMIHDCVITASWLVLFVAPALFDFAASPPLRWDPARGTRIALVPRDGGPVRWIATEPFWVWHFANGYETRDAAGATHIVIDFARWDAPSFLPGARGEGSIVRARLDPVARTARFDTIDGGLAEFPRIDDRLVGTPHRYVYIVQKTPAAGRGHWDLLRRYDMTTGRAATFTPGAPIGEPVFAPARAATAEDAGYVLAYRFAGSDTHLVVLQADRLEAAPVAVLRMPQRVPVGLHGIFVPAPS